MSISKLQALVEQSELDFFEFFCRYESIRDQTLWHASAELEGGKSVITGEYRIVLAEALTSLTASLPPSLQKARSDLDQLNINPEIEESIQSLVSFLEERAQLGNPSWLLTIYYGPMPNELGWIVSLTGIDPIEVQLSREGAILSKLCDSLNQDVLALY